MSNRVVLAAGVLVALTQVAAAAPRPVTVYLDRNGQVVDHDGEEVTIPKFGGGDAAWRGIVGCVKKQFEPFQIEVVDRRPASGDFITALIGGRASLLDLDDDTTNGVGPYIAARVQRNALVHIFSKVGTGERDIENLCAVTVHEVAHALGLDHTYKCGDVMSYFLDRCGPRKFMDVDAPCGELSARLCGDGSKTQNSYRMLATLVGLKNADADDSDDSDDTAPQVDPWADDEPEVEQPAPEPRRWRGRRWGRRWR